MNSPRPSQRPSLGTVLLVTGKGGVGKTTVAAGLAVAAQQTYGAAALVEFGDGESGRRALGKSRKGVDHIVLEPHESVIRAATPLFGSTLLAKVALGNFAINRLVRAAPGVRELSMLECIRDIAASHPGRRVIVDLPATGHGISWLRSPAQIRDITVAGPFHELADRICRELVHPSRCSVVVVTLPERLVVSETMELCASLPREVGLKVSRVIVNRVPAAIPPESLQQAEAFAKSADPFHADAEELLRALLSREGARKEALEALQLAATVSGLAPIVLPEVGADPAASTVAEWLRGEEAL